MNPKLTTLILLVVLFLASAAPALAQCSMCRENAAAADNSRAINLGIAVLLVPTLVLFVGVLAFALRRRDSVADSPNNLVPSATPVRPSALPTPGLPTA